MLEISYINSMLMDQDRRRHTKMSTDLAVTTDETCLLAYFCQ